MRYGLLVPAVLVSCLLGCGGPAPVAYENRTFYDYGVGTSAEAARFETPFPKLDLAAHDSSPDFVGVTILGGRASISRPRNWVIRSASLAPGQRFIQYVSANQYLIAIWERPDYADSLWRDVQARYLEDAKNAGAQIIAGPVPVAMWNAQGREFLVERKVPAAKSPLTSTVREFLVRGEGRVLLVQINYQEDQLAANSAELIRLISTMHVH
ncbi:MAG: hypothetical protein ACXWUG_12075 [Polyangiales bacterium]